MVCNISNVLVFLCGPIRGQQLDIKKRARNKKNNEKNKFLKNGKQNICTKAT